MRHGPAPLDNPRVPKETGDGISAIVDGFNDWRTELERQAEEAVREQAMKEAAERRKAEMTARTWLKDWERFEFMFPDMETVWDVGVG